MREVRSRECKERSVELGPAFLFINASNNRCPLRLGSTRVHIHDIWRQRQIDRHKSIFRRIIPPLAVVVGKLFHPTTVVDVQVSTPL